MTWPRASMIFVLLFTDFVLQAQPGQPISYQTSVIRDFQLINPKTADRSFFECDTLSRFYLFVFLSPDCPLSQQYSVSLNDISDAYHRDVTMIGIFPGKGYDRSTITDFLRKYKIRFTTYVDETKKLSNYLVASVTPEVILLSNQKKLLTETYRGAIDDRVIDLSKKKVKADKYYLLAAIEQCLQKKEVIIKKTNPVGCLINDY